MKTFTDFDSTFGTTVLDFMDRVPGVIPSIFTFIIVIGFWFLG